MEKCIRNSSGFSLVSVLIAVGLAGGLALVIMQLSGNMTSIESRSMASLDAKELLTEFRLILDDERHCRLSLAGEDPAASPVKFRKNDIDNLESDEGLPVEIWIGNIEGTNRARKKFSESDEQFKKYGKLTIESIRLFMNVGTGVYPDGNGSDLGTIRLKYSYLQNKVPKGYFQDFLVKVSFITNGGESTIQSCSRSSGSASNTTFKRANCTLSGYQNNFDQPVNFTCPGNKAFGGESSYHNSGNEDRRFQFNCCDVLNQDNTVLTRRLCFSSGTINHFDQDLFFTCPPGYLVTGTSSHHSNHHEDRVFSYSCCDYGGADSTVRWSDMNYSGWINNWDGPVNFNCGANEFICGVDSAHDNDKEDRRFAFKCCKAEALK